jgi:hypothetical protein
MLLGRSPKDLQSIKIFILPIPFSVVRTLVLAWIETTSGFVLLDLAMITIGKVSAGQWVELVEGDAVVPQAGEELGLYGPVESIVDTLICHRFDPPVFIADLADLSDFPGCVVADTESFEVSFCWLGLVLQ